MLRLYCKVTGRVSPEPASRDQGGSLLAAAALRAKKEFPAMKETATTALNDLAAAPRKMESCVSYMRRTERVLMTTTTSRDEDPYERANCARAATHWHSICTSWGTENQR